MGSLTQTHLLVVFAFASTGLTGNFSVLLYARSQLWRKDLQPPLKNPWLYFGPMRYFHFKIPGCSVLRIQEHKHQAELAKLETRREGEEIQRLNQLYQLEIQRGRENEQEEKLELQRQHHEHVAEQKVIKDEEKQREDQDDDRIRAYIRGKEMMADLRREADAETSRLVQEHQDKAFQQLAGQMNQTLRMEAERFARGAAEVEDEYQMKTKEREAKNKAAIESIAEHRATVVKMKLEKEIEDKAENEKECHAFMEKNRIYLEGEEAKKQRQRDASVEVQKIQLQQMAEKKAKKEQEKQADLDYDAQREAAFCKEQKFWR